METTLCKGKRLCVKGNNYAGNNSLQRETIMLRQTVTQARAILLITSVTLIVLVVSKLSFILYVLVSIAATR